MCRWTIHKGIMPRTPNDMSMSCHQNGIPRMGPAMRANGIIATQHSIAHWTTQMLRTGSR